MNTTPFSESRTWTTHWYQYTTIAGSYWGTDSNYFERAGFKLLDKSVLKGSPLAHGANLSLPYTREELTRSRGFCLSVVRLFPDDLATKVSGEFLSPPVFDGAYWLDTTVRTEAKRKLVDKLHGFTSGDFDAALAMLEARQTARLIGEKGELVSDAFDKFAKENQPLLDRARRARGGGNGRAFSRRVLKRVSGRYLELVFGVLPLLQDLDSAAKDIAEGLYGSGRGSKVKRVSASVENRRNAEYAPRNLGNYGGCYIWTTTYARDITTYFYHGAVIASSGYDSFAAYHASRMMGLSKGCLDFVPTLWEAIPYSFLADYFLDLGSYAKATALYGQNVSIYSVSYKNTRELWRLAEDGNTDWYGTGVSSVGRFDLPASSTLGLRFIREAGGETLFDYLAGFNIPGGRRLVNIAALAVNRFTR